MGINQMTQEIAGSNTSHVAQMKAVGDVVMVTAWSIVAMNFAASSVAGGYADEVLTAGGADAGAGMQSLQGIIWSMVILLLV